MNANILLAVGLILVASVMNATYTLPMRLNRRWSWEHSWAAFTILGLGVVPLLLCLLTVPDLCSVYAAASPATLWALAIFGALWGVSLVLFGRSIAMVGLAITFAVVMGTSAASGALIPLLTQHPEKIMTREGGLILLGIAGMLAGVGLYGVAGYQRDNAGVKAGVSRQSFLPGFLYALLSGVTGSLLNVGFAYGGDIQRAALAHGASQAMMSNAVWLPAIYAGAVPGVIYCFYLMKKNGNVRQFLSQARWYYWLMGASMGLLWFGSVMAYGISTVELGALGPVIGWPLFMSGIVLASTVVGLRAGEWKHAGSRPVRIMLGGLAMLAASMAVLSQAGR